MLDFANRRFTVQLGRRNKPGLVNGERTSVVGRKTSTRRVSVRKSSLRHTPSRPGGPHRATSVRRSQSGLRRGASVRRAPSSAQRNSKRTSVCLDGIMPSTVLPSSSTEPGPATSLKPPVLLDMASNQPTATAAPSKSFFSKLTSRFRTRPKETKAQTPPNSSAIAATFSAANLLPVGCALPRSPSLRSPSPGSRVTFVDTVVEPSRAADDPLVQSRTDPSPGADKSPQDPESDDASPAEKLVDESGGDDEWVDAEDDGSEPRIPLPDAVIGSVHAVTVLVDSAVPEEAHDLSPVAQVTESEETACDQPEVVQLQAELVNDLARELIGIDVRVSQWLAVTPPVVVDEESTAAGDGRTISLESILVDETTMPTVSKVETKRRPPHIALPSPSSALSSNNPFRVPLPPSPSPSNISQTLPETDPFRALIAAPSNSTSPEHLIAPPSPSILLTPAIQQIELEFKATRQSDELLVADLTQIPPPSPSPSHASTAPAADQVSVSGSSSMNAATVMRSGSVSTSGGRSLSTAPSTRGPATPTSRIPGHPAFAHFSFGGPRSPSLKMEDWEESEEECRGRSLEVKSDKRRMRSTSPRLDAVLEGDESRRSSKASIGGLEHETSLEAQQPLSPLPVVQEVSTFGRRSDDTDDENEEENGFFAFAEQQLQREKAHEACLSEAPKRSKTMSFLAVGFGKRKSTTGDPGPMSRPAVTRSTASSGLFGAPMPTPKRSLTLAAPTSDSSNRISRLVPEQRSSTMMTMAEPRTAVSPTMYSVGDIHAEMGKIEDEESRRLSEAVFMF